MTPYKTKDGDMLDRLCWLQYKRWRASDLEAVAAANPDLVHDDGYELLRGQTIIFPEIGTPDVSPALETFWTVTA